jgi:hypothetical protein
LSAASNPLFGRKYQLQIIPSNGSAGNAYTLTDSAWEPEALRLTFDVYTSWWSTPWYADISIYNLNEATSSQLFNQVQQGMEVILSAGYLNGKYGVIWDGFVLQPLWERENQIDFKLTLHCINWLGAVSSNYINKSWAAGAQQQQIVADIAANSYHPIGVGQITQTLNNKTLPRSKTAFGNPGKFLSETARDNNLQWWLGKKGLLNFTGLSGTAAQSTPIDTTNAVVYTPSSGIVGTPRQTQLGVDLRVLLDPTVEVKIPCMCVNIQNTQIQQLLYQVGQYPGLLNKDGTYAVIGASYRGDTRGQEWYTDVTGWFLASAQLAALVAGQGAQLANGG